jgi:hypothetical protein
MSAAMRHGIVSVRPARPPRDRLRPRKRLALPVTDHTLAQSWHVRADAWWVGTPVHTAATP